MEAVSSLALAWVARVTSNYAKLEKLCSSQEMQNVQAAISQSVDRATLEAQLVPAQSRTSKEIHGMVKLCDGDLQSHSYLLKLPSVVFAENTLEDLKNVTIMPSQAKTLNCMLLVLMELAVGLLSHAGHAACT